MKEYTTGQKGDIALTKVINRCLELGYLVSLPFSESSRYDLIVDVNGILKRVQVKYCGSNNEETACCNLRRRTSSKSSEYRMYTSDEIDWVLGYIPYTDSIVKFEKDMFENKSTITIRFIEPKNNQKSGIILESDYRL